MTRTVAYLSLLLTLSFIPTFAFYGSTTTTTTKITIPFPQYHFQHPPTTTALFDKKSSKKPLRAKPKGFAGALRELQLTTFPYAGSIRPGTQSPQKKVTVEGMIKPDYSDDGVVRGCWNCNCD